MLTKKTASSWLLIYAFSLIYTNANLAFYYCGCFAAFRPQLPTVFFYPSEAGETDGISSPPQSVSSWSRFRVPSASSPGGSPVSFNSAVPLYGRNAHLANFLFACFPPSSRWRDVKRKSRHLKMTSSLPINHLPPLSRLHCLFFFFFYKCLLFTSLTKKWHGGSNFLHRSRVCLCVCTRALTCTLNVTSRTIQFCFHKLPHSRQIVGRGVRQRAQSERPVWRLWYFPTIHALAGVLFHMNQILHKGSR